LTPCLALAPSPVRPNIASSTNGVSAWRNAGADGGSTIKRGTVDMGTKAQPALPICAPVSAPISAPVSVLAPDPAPSAARAPVLSIVIATARRRASLVRTLRDLAPAAMPAEAEIVVVDNSPERELSTDGLAAAIGDAHAARVRLVHHAPRGKWRCLNAVVNGDVGDTIGDTIAVLDDDMAPMPGWPAAVLDSVRSRPDSDLFAGKSTVQWPAGLRTPEWAEHYLAQNVCFSVLHWEGERDREMGGIFPAPSGNHFWFRRRVLETVGRFPPGWTTEAQFCLRARALGHRGVLIPQITCRHRVQPELVDPEVFMARALSLGHTLGRLGRAEQRDDRARPGPAGGTARTLARRGKSAAALALWTLRERRARQALSRSRGGSRDGSHSQDEPRPELVIARARARLQRGRHEALLGRRREIGDAP